MSIAVAGNSADRYWPYFTDCTATSSSAASAAGVGSTLRRATAKTAMQDVSKQRAPNSRTVSSDSPNDAMATAIMKNSIGGFMANSSTYGRLPLSMSLAITINVASSMSMIS